MWVSLGGRGVLFFQINTQTPYWLRSGILFLWLKVASVLGRLIMLHNYHIYKYLYMIIDDL